MLSDLGQKNALAELFIMTWPSNLGPLQHFDNAAFKRGRKHHPLKKIYLWSKFFFSLKWDIISVPNPRGEYFATNLTIENDLNVSN